MRLLLLAMTYLRNSLFDSSGNGLAPLGDGIREGMKRTLDGRAVMVLRELERERKTSTSRAMISNGGCRVRVKERMRIEYKNKKI